MDTQNQLPRIRLILLFFAVALFVSGATAIPIRFELNLLHAWFGPESAIGQLIPSVALWITIVHQAIEDISVRYPFLIYGYDWLAFGHFVIAISFVGAIRDPIRNRWIVEYAMIACVLLVPYALVMGEIRGIPIGWRLIDSLFGVVGIIPLYLVRKMIISAEVARK